MGHYSGSSTDRRKHMTGKRAISFNINDNNLELSDARGVSSSVIYDPHPTDDNPSSPIPKPESSKDDIGEPSDDKPGLLEGDGAVGGVKDIPQSRSVGMLTLDKTCEYVRGGHCLVHGGGATRKFRGGHKVVVGRGGGRTKRYQRSYYYVCEPREGGQIQPRLSLVKMTPKQAETDDAQNFDVNTSKVGQNGNCTKTGMSIDEKDLVDEK